MHLNIEKIEFTAKDTLIAISTSGINPVTTDVALYAKSKGAANVVITSKEYSRSQRSRHKDDLKLYEIGDIVIDNHIPTGDDLMTYSSSNVKFGSASTIIGNLILQNIFSETIFNCFKEKESPPVFMSGNLENSTEHNQKLVEKYQERITILR